MLKEQFQPRARINLNSRRIYMINFKDSELYQKNIELELTNGVGYTKESWRYGRELSSDELQNYLQEMNELAENNQIELSHMITNELVYLHVVRDEEIKKCEKYLSKRLDETMSLIIKRSLDHKLELEEKNIEIKRLKQTIKNSKKGFFKAIFS